MSPNTLTGTIGNLKTKYCDHDNKEDHSILSLNCVFCFCHSYVKKVVNTE